MKNLLASSLDLLSDLGGSAAKMKTTLATLLLVAFGVACAGCGGASSQTGSVAGARPVPRHSGAPLFISGAKVDLEPLEQDEDDDDGPGEEKGLNPKDSDIDGDNDNLKPLGYYDHDDGAIRAYGHAASATDKRELTVFIKRYFTAAADEDGATACSMLTTVVANSIPETYGRGSAGPAFLRKASTCPAVLTLVFNHLHAQLVGPFEIVRPRVDGEKARVLFSAKGMPASYLELQRVGSQWRSVEMLAAPLP